MHRILIVSEEEFLSDVIRLSLADMRTDVRCVSGVAAMERLSRRMLFDLVIVVGTSLLFRAATWSASCVLRDCGGRSLVYVVAWQQAEQSVLSLLECGVDRCLTCPVSLQRLRTKVANELDRQVLTERLLIAYTALAALATAALLAALCVSRSFAPAAGAAAIPC